MKVFNLFRSLLTATLGIVKLAMVAAVIVAVVTLVIKFAPSMSAVESTVETVMGKASKQVGKGLQAVGVDQNADQSAKQGIDSKPQGTAHKKAKTKDVAAAEAAKSDAASTE